jgi:hypothetical protein
MSLPQEDIDFLRQNAREYGQFQGWPIEAQESYSEWIVDLVKDYDNFDDLNWMNHSTLWFEWYQDGGEALIKDSRHSLAYKNSSLRGEMRSQGMLPDDYLQVGRDSVGHWWASVDEFTQLGPFDTREEASFALADAQEAKAGVSDDGWFHREPSLAAWDDMQAGFGYELDDEFVNMEYPVNPMGQQELMNELELGNDAPHWDEPGQVGGLEYDIYNSFGIQSSRRTSMDSILSDFDVDWGYEYDPDSWAMGEDSLVVGIFDPDTEEVLDSIGGVSGDFQISDHGNVNPSPDFEAYLYGLAREMAQEYRKTASKKRANEMMGYPEDDMMEEPVMDDTMAMDESGKPPVANASLSFWDNASEGIEAERREAAVQADFIEVEPVREFLLMAKTHAEYVDRKALVEDRLAKLPYRLTVEGSIDADFRRQAALWDIVAYTYKADMYCPEHIVPLVAADLSLAAPQMETEGALDILAGESGIDRYDEYSFDSGDFPKVVFRDQIGEYDTCGAGHQITAKRQGKQKRPFGKYVSQGRLFAKKADVDAFWTTDQGSFVGDVPGASAVDVLRQIFVDPEWECASCGNKGPEGQSVNIVSTGPNSSEVTCAKCGSGSVSKVIMIPSSWQGRPASKIAKKAGREVFDRSGYDIAEPGLDIPRAKSYLVEDKADGLYLCEDIGGGMFLVSENDVVNYFTDTGLSGKEHKYVEIATGAKTAGRRVSSQRYDIAKQVVESHTAGELPGGILLDSFTASALVQVYEALSSENQAKFDEIPLDKLVAFVMSHVSVKIKKKSVNINAAFLREWIFKNWLLRTPETEAEVECMLSNKDNWQHIEAMGERYRSQRWGDDSEIEQDDMGVDEALGFAITGLIEGGHGAPHKDNCPLKDSPYYARKKKSATESPDFLGWEEVPMTDLKVGDVVGNSNYAGQPPRNQAEILRPVEEGVEGPGPLAGRPVWKFWARSLEDGREGYLLYGQGAGVLRQMTAARKHG